MKFTLNYVNYVGMTEFIEFNVKQLANWPAHLPRVQAPVYMNILDGAPGVHHKRRPQGMTKMTQKIHWITLKLTEQALNGVILHVCEHRAHGNYFNQKLTKSGNFYIEMLLVC